MDIDFIMSYPIRTYGDILSDERELITIQRLVWLFKSVQPKLKDVLNNHNNEFLQRWNGVKHRISNTMDDEESHAFIKSITDLYSTKILNYEKIIDHFALTCSKFVERFEAQLEIDEMSLLRLMIESDNLIVSTFDILRDADAIENEIAKSFKEMLVFVDDIWGQIQVFSKAKSSLRALK